MKIESNQYSYSQQIKPATEIKPVAGVPFNEEKKKELVSNSIKFEINKSGDPIIHFKDMNGEEKQIPSKVAIEQSERIQKFLQRLEDDIYPSPFKKIDLKA